MQVGRAGATGLDAVESGRSSGGISAGLSIQAEGWCREGGRTFTLNGRDQLMEFMLILSEDPQLVVTDEQRQEAVQRVGEYAMGLLGSGTLKGGAPLHPVTEAKRIRTRDGQQRVLDGPFAESKEVIAGYFVIEAADLDTAVKIASGCPNAEFGSVEVREIVPLA
jgi:hypothetical protein